MRDLHWVASGDVGPPRSLWARWNSGALALSVLMAGGPTASGSVASVPGSSGPGGIAPRFPTLGFAAAARDRAEGRGVALLGGAVEPGPRRGFVVLGGSPGAAAANPKTNTLYLPIQCTTSSCTTPGNVVDLINAATCNSKVISDCRVLATANVGNSPLAAAIDSGTDTIYVVNGASNTVSVLNGAQCNAQVTTGCSRAVATVTVGTFPVSAVVNPVTCTLYVANATSGTISVISTAACNAKITSGCQHPGRAVADNASPSWLDVDTATDTIYVANGITPGTVSVIDGAACNGRTGSGCGQAPATVAVGNNPYALAVDQANDTIYVANSASGSVSVINGATCNAHTTAGCSQTPPAVPTGLGAGFVAVDGALHTAFAVNAGDDTISTINTRTCNGTVTASSATRPPNQQATALQRPGYNAFPGDVILLGKTGTAYLVDIGGRNIVSVTSIAGCNATDTTRCRTEAATGPDGELLLSADPATNTLYGSSLSQPQIDVINGATCHAADLSGCAPVAAIPMADPGANVGAIDQATHTLYASDESSSGTVEVINTATCNATHTAGCATHPPMINIGAYPGPPALNPATHTLYVPYGSTGNKVAVIDASICNATDTTGCGQTPAVVNVGTDIATLAVSAATDTIYAPASGTQYSGDTVVGDQRRLLQRHQSQRLRATRRHRDVGRAPRSRCQRPDPHPVCRQQRRR